MLSGTIEVLGGCYQISATVSVEELKAKNYDLKAVNPNRKQEEDTRTPEELFSIIEAQGTEISTALAALRDKGV